MKFQIAAAVLLAASSSEAFSLQRRRTNHGVAFVGSRSQGSLIPRFVTALTKEELQLSEDADALGKGESFVPTNRDVSAIAAGANTAAYLKQYEGVTGAHAVYSKLQEYGVTVVNGYSGGAILPLLDMFHREHPRHDGAESKCIRWITNSNESSAGHVAEGISKSTQEVGVVVATSGPGVTNLITPLQDAICDGVPMVVLCGQAATTAPKDAFQSSPAVALTSPCTKWSYQIRSAAELPFALDYAFYIAANGRPGPVFLDLPKDLQIQHITPELIKKFMDSLYDGDQTGFARWVTRRNEQGDTVQALEIGEPGKGLLFGAVEDENEPGRFKLSALPSLSQFSRDAFSLDHRPTNTIYQSKKVVNGEEKKVTTEGNLYGSAFTAELAQFIKSAKKPVIIAGQGCNDCPEGLKELAEKLQIPVSTTLHALGCFDERHPLALNMVGMHGHPTPNYMVQTADLILCIGSRFDDRITGRLSDYAPEARKAEEEGRGGIIHVDIRLSTKGQIVKPTYFVHSTGKSFLEALNEELSKDESSEPQTGEWLNNMKKLQAEFPIKIPRYPTQKVKVRAETGETIEVGRTKMSAQLVVAEMNKQILEAGIMDDTIFSTGVGIHQMVAAQLVTWTKPRQMISSGSLGTMGVALGYAIGAQLGNKGKIVIAIDGDGSFNMTFTELKTLAEHKIPCKIMILDNEAQMMVEYWQRLFHGGRYLAVRNELNPVYTTLADSFRIKNLYCDCEEDLPAKMKEFLFDDPEEPVLFHVRITRTPCLPLVAPGKPLDEMILEDEDFEVDPNATPS